MSDPEPTNTSLPPPDRTLTFDACETPPTSIVNTFGKVEIVAGSRVRPETAFQAVLRQRLLAAAIVLCVGFGLFLIRSFFYERPLQGWHTLVVFVEGVCVALLSSPRPFSLRQLRWFELVTFGLPVLFFVPYLHTFMLFEARRGSAVLTLAAFKSVALYWLVTLVFYGLLVPNDWRRAAKIVIPMTFVPPLVAVFTRPFHELAAQVVTFEQWSDVQLVLIIGAVCSIYGTHIMNSLRQEAFEAKQFGQYRLVRRLGEGGMGQVFLAEHQLLKRPCAIKLIKPGPLCHPQALARFEREVRATAKLTHWNTIDIYDYGRTDDGTFYYVMEYLPGVNLDELIQESGPLPPARVVHVLRQLCQALREAACARLDSPRYQAQQRHPLPAWGGGRRRQVARFRARQIHDRKQHHPVDSGRHHHWDTQVHVTRTVFRQGGRGCPQRHLLPGRGGLCTACRPGAV